MRLIDADKMAVEESEAYMSAQCKIKDDLTRSVNAVVHTKIQRLISDTPTVDTVGVVQCKDCKHWLKDVPVRTGFMGNCVWGIYIICDAAMSRRLRRWLCRCPRYASRSSREE